MRIWEFLKLALEGVRRTPLRVTLTALGVAIATGALVAMVGFALGLQSRIEEPLEKLDLLSRIDVTAREASEGKPEGKAALLDDAAVARLGTIPGVALAFPEISRAGIRVSRGKASRTVFATGVPPAAASLPPIRNLLIAGRLFEPGRNDRVVLSESLVRGLEFASPAAALGQRVTLEARGLRPGAGGAFTFDRKEMEVEVAGVWRSPWGGLGPKLELVVLPLDLIRTLPGVELQAAIEQLDQGGAPAAEGYRTVVVRVRRPSDLARVARSIEAMGLRAGTVLDQVKQMKTAFVAIDLLLAAVGTVALVVAALGIVNTLLMAVLERYAEIGTYKALGASNGDVRLLFLMEAALVGLLGGAGGIALGRAVSWGIQLGVDRYARSREIEEAVVVFHFPGWLLLGALAFAVAASLASGVYPASRAARVDPIRALRSW